MQSNLAQVLEAQPVAVRDQVLKILSANRGDKEIFIDNDDPKDRKVLADSVDLLRKQGYSVFYRMKGETAFTRVDGYDPELNTWILGRGKKAKMVPAVGTEATAVAPVAGG